MTDTNTRSAHQAHLHRTTILSAEEVGRSFGGLRAVDAVSIEVKRGAVTGLIGPNGAGKSTLLNILSGALSPTDGRIKLDGRDVTNRATAARARRGVRRTFQMSRLVEEITLFENVVAGTRGQRRLRDAYRRSATALLRARVPEQRWDKYPGQSSPQEHRWIEIARAMAGRAEVYLFDEPTAGFGEVDTQAFLELIHDLARRDNAGVLVVSHDVAFTIRACDVVVAMDHGRQIASGTASEVMNDSIVREVYLGTAAQRVIAAVVKSEALTHADSMEPGSVLTPARARLVEPSGEEGAGNE